MTNSTKSWVYIYMLLSELGEVYLGCTTRLRRRLKRHNSPNNKGWTAGRHWHLLAVREFPTKDAGFLHEHELKKRPHQKIKWKLECMGRAIRIRNIYRYRFRPEDWPLQHSYAVSKKKRLDEHNRTQCGT